MLYLQLHRMDRENDLVFELQIGEHIIGRGPLINCTSKKVSRNHAILKVTEETGVILLSTHTNPCFYKSSDLNHMNLITNGMSTVLNNDDVFGLLPDEYWYKVKLKDLDTSDDQNASTATKDGLKRSRSSDKSETETVNKKTCTVPECNTARQDELLDKEAIAVLTSLKAQSQVHENNCPSSSSSSTKPINLHDDENVINNCRTNENEDKTANDVSDYDTPSPDFLAMEFDSELTNINNNSPNLNINMVVENQQLEQEVIEPDKKSIESEVAKLEDKLDNIIENPNHECSSIEEGNNDVTQVVTDVPDNKVKEEKDVKKPTDSTNPSTSGTNPVHRDRCWYGNSCYRKNMVHKTEFSHPGDDDYNSDPNDTRPICSYGASCYRKNKNHRKMFRHPNQGKPGSARPTKGNVRQKKRQVKPVVVKTQSDSEDSYDYCDPFINDGSSDDFEPSDMSESDDDDDDEGEDESQETTKRLKKEAKKFTKKD